MVFIEAFNRIGFKTILFFPEAKPLLLNIFRRLEGI
jgi:hypothetical protein